MIIFHGHLRTLNVSGEFIGNNRDGFGGNLTILNRNTNKTTRVVHNFHDGEVFDTESINRIIRHCRIKGKVIVRAA